jgi:mono/diheme cytochrome c family protein
MLIVLVCGGCSRPSITQGRTLYQENGCGSCHGPDGHGDGPLAAKLAAHPIDFRDASEFKRGTSEDDIARTLAQGIAILHTMPALQHTHHMLVMPQFNHLTKTQRRSIALYVISLRTENSQRSVQP